MKYSSLNNLELSFNPYDMQRLISLAKEAKINENANIKDQHSLIINAPIEKVWDKLTDIKKWPEWHPEIESISLKGNVEEGTQFIKVQNGTKINATIQLLEKPNALATTNKTGLIKGVNVWELEQNDDQTTLTYSSSQQGVLTVFVVNHQKIYHEITSWLEYFQKSLES